MSLWKRLFEKKENSCCHVVIQEVKETRESANDKKESEQKGVNGSCCQ